MVMSEYVGLLSLREESGLAADMDPLMECLWSGRNNRDEHERAILEMKPPKKPQTAGSDLHV